MSWRALKDACSDLLALSFCFCKWQGSARKCFKQFPCSARKCFKRLPPSPRMPREATPARVARRAPPHPRMPQEATPARGAGAARIHYEQLARRGTPYFFFFFVCVFCFFFCYLFLCLFCVGGPPPVVKVKRLDCRGSASASLPWSCSSLDECLDECHQCG